MPHIKLREQPRYEFTYRFTIQAVHINYRGHLGHDSIVLILNEARANMFRALGISELDLGDRKTGVITGDTVINYKSEGFIYQTLSVESRVGEIGPDGFTVFQRIKRDGHLVALAEAGLVGFDYKIRATVPIPETFNQALAKYRKAKEQDDG
ncbi:MAG TPA: thioesterase family protein [Syntrophorhabdales bacterium]|nr:thioesterase family protein [Syntrophorhabdales bacterium]